MSDGLLNEMATAVEHLLSKAAQEMFGTGGGGSDASLDAIRWEGLSNGQLAAAVRQLNSGPGATGIQQAADALATIASDLQQIDQTLHQQLQAIGVNWQSEAAELAQEMTTESAAYSTSAGAASGASAAAVNAQGDAYTAAKNAVPEPSVLTGSTTAKQTSFLSSADAILTGHNNDQVRTVAKTNAARQQTIDALTTYTATSKSGLSTHQPLPRPPAITLQPKPVDTSIGQTTTVAGYVPPPPTLPSGAGGGGTGVITGGGGLPGGGTGVGPVGGGGTLPGLPGLGGVSAPAPGLPGVAPGLPGGASEGTMPGLPGVTTPGLPGSTTPGLPGVPTPGGGGGSAGGVVGPRVPGSPVGGGGSGTPLAPGPVSGVGSLSGPTSGVSSGSAAASGVVSGALIEDAAVGSAIVGGTVGAGVGGATARQDELVRSRDLARNEPAEESTDARAQAARALADLEGEEAAEAGVAARIGATAEPPPTLLEPAVVGRDDDDEHSNRYGIDDDDMFGDGRMVVPPVLDGGDTGDFGPHGSK